MRLDGVGVGGAVCDVPSSSSCSLQFSSSLHLTFSSFVPSSDFPAGVSDWPFDPFKLGVLGVELTSGLV